MTMMRIATVIFLLTALWIAPAPIRAQGAGEVTPQTIDDGGETTSFGDDPIELEGEVSADEDAAVIFGSELEEDQVGSLFSSDDAVMRLLDAEHAYVYRGEGLPDPFLIPWERDEVVAGEMLDKAAQLQTRNRFHEARSMLEEILSDYGQTKAAEKVPGRLASIDLALQAQQAAEAQPQEQEHESEERSFPPTLQKNIAGIMYDEDMPLVLIADEMLAEGESPRGYDDVSVKSIGPKQVIFLFDGRDHLVIIDALQQDVNR